MNENGFYETGVFSLGAFIVILSQWKIKSSRPCHIYHIRLLGECGGGKQDKAFRAEGLETRSGFETDNRSLGPSTLETRLAFCGQEFFLTRWSVSSTSNLE